MWAMSYTSSMIAFALKKEKPEPSRLTRFSMEVHEPNFRTGYPAEQGKSNLVGKGYHSLQCRLRTEQD